MKRLTYMMMALLLMGLIGCKRSQADRYQRYLEEKDDTTFEYIPEKTDSVAVADPAETRSDVGDYADDDGIVAIPDIPGERPVDMSADDYEVKKAMSGRQ